ncbi:hypothetical protein [Paenibacillus rigui]|uniref:Methyltransferase n=1 Tax=Paenibacillus rigui TaxID=554312 RepID=A0A229UX27_9BACL|nr:hypothetical protein [Paenibacillus rigui]OXM87913.1 hypothetical protein CF651_02060 [Paenibacillus rigui]
MSRKWERMVQKNTKAANNIRKKQGKPTLSEASSDGAVTIRGRSWLLPLLLMFVGLFCFIAFRAQQQQDSLYWITGGSYIVLALFIFAVRRPFLKVGKNYLLTRRFAGDRRVEPSQIQEIELTKSSVVISLNTSKTKWVFTRFIQRIDIEQMSDKLKEFAANNNIPLKVEA